MLDCVAFLSLMKINTCPVNCLVDIMLLSKVKKADYSCLICYLFICYLLSVSEQCPVYNGDIHCTQYSKQPMK